MNAGRSGRPSPESALSEPIVYLNGEYLPLSEARVPVLDRGFIFGDGIYDVAPVYEGRPFRLTEHLARLSRNLATIRIRNPLDDAGWRALIDGLLSRHPQWPNQVVYLHVTRGVAPREHGFPADTAPTVFAMTNPFTPPTLENIGNGLSTISLPDERWLHCDIKSISLLGNLLARQAAVDAGAAEAVLFRDGMLTEGAAANIWVVRDGTLLAPPRNNLILEGIRYQLLLTLAERCGIPVEIRPISRDEVQAADELLLTSATKEVQPITCLDGKAVGKGVPGPIFRRLFEAYQAEKHS